MTKINDDVLRKIKRCMDLSSSSNENEAALALKQMQSLMSKYGVNSQHVQAFDVCEHSSRIDVVSRPAKWVVQLHRVIGQAMDCQSILRPGYGKKKAEIVYLGVDASPEIAGYAFEVLFRKLKVDRAAFIQEKLSRYKTKNKVKLADAYCEGWVSSVYSKVKNLNPNLDVEEKIKAYQATAMPDLKKDAYQPKARYKKSDDKAQAAAAMGYEKSQDVELFAATGHTKQALIGQSA